MTDPDNTEATLDDLLVASLADGLTYEETGGLAGVSARTVQRRMSDKTFAARVREARSQRINEIVGQLTEASTMAAGVFRAGMGPQQPMNIRLSAATASLRHLRDFRSSADLEQRLQELEASSEKLVAVLEAHGLLDE